jgi:hypothetical protein
MIQSRFFHSSIQEIELHVKEIHSLQGELREKILTSLNKSATKVKYNEKNIQGFSNTAPIVILSELSSTKLASSPTIDILEKSISEKLTSNNQLSKIEAGRNKFEPRQSNNNARISDYETKFPDKNIDILIFSLSFFIWGINLIFLLLFIFI